MCSSGNYIYVKMEVVASSENKSHHIVNIVKFLSVETYVFTNNADSYQAPRL